eukprot:scaffold248_cov263-Chaetoceros_neogracile.AAC.11
MNAILNLGAAVTVVLVSLSFYLEDVYKAENNGGKDSSRFESHILVIFSILWIVEAGALTFSGPFLVTGTGTGNGYISSWMTAILSVKATIHGRIGLTKVNILLIFSMKYLSNYTYIE